MQHYIRFGLWPQDERSKIGDAFRQSRAWVYNAVGEDQPEFEDGVSVYEANWNEPKGRWEIPSLATDSYLASLDELINERRDIYLVTGEDIDAGSDGEPLIRNVKLVKPLSYSEIYNDHCYNEDIILSEEPSPIKPWAVTYLLKHPDQKVKSKKGCLTVEQIQEDLGGHYQMQGILPGIVMLVRELDSHSGVKPNITWPSWGWIYGPLIITALRPKAEIIKEHQKLPWPWHNPELDYDDQDTTAPGAEFRSLQKEEISKIKKFLNSPFRQILDPADSRCSNCGVKTDERKELGLCLGCYQKFARHYQIDQLCIVCKGPTGHLKISEGVITATRDEGYDLGLCEKCYEEAGLENEHQDGGHEEQANTNCPMCRENKKATE